MLRYRLITGPLLILVLLGVVLLDDWMDTLQLSGIWQDIFAGRTAPPRGIVLFVIALLIAPLAAVELSHVFKSSGIATRRWLTALAAMTGLVLSFAVPNDAQASTAIAIVASGFVAIVVLSLLTFSSNKTVQGVLAATGAVLFAMVYLGFMLGFLLAIRQEHSAWWIVGIILTTKACDIGAYFTGTLIGRHKLIVWLSPGKTWEGLFGGIAVSIIVGMLMAGASTWLNDPADHLPLWVGALCGGVFAVVGQFGDLTMSLFKRGAGVKDTSQLLPGMGGVLDVLDSPLMVAPVAYWLLILMLGFTAV
jgi:phosphatidate cytidylyltransferase